MIKETLTIIFLFVPTFTLNSNGDTLTKIPPRAIRFVHSETLVKQAWAPSLSPDEKKVAFVKSDDSRKTDVNQADSQIWIMNSDGSAKQQLTSGEGFKHSPIFNPAGDLILFVQEPGEIFLTRQDGTNLQKLPIDDKCSSQAAWSPNGQVIAFDAADQSKGIVAYNFEQGNLLYINTPGEKTEWIRPVNLTFSPDSQRLYFLFRQMVYYLDVSNKTIKQIQPANQFWLSPNGRFIACLMIKSGQVPSLYLVDAETFKPQRLYEQSESERHFYGGLIWSPDSSKILCGNLLFDITSKIYINLDYLSRPVMPGFDCKHLWFSQGKKIIRENEIITMVALPPKERYKNRSISLCSIDWNATFASKEEVMACIPEVKTALARALSPTRAEKLLNQTQPQGASTRVVCTEIVNRIYDKMLRLAYNKYPEELKNVITQTDRWIYADPLVDGANWGFLRRLKSLDPLYGDFIKLDSSFYDPEPKTLIMVQNIWGYPVSVKERQISTTNANELNYVSQCQRVQYGLTITGSEELRGDVVQLLFQELEPFFALEFLFDANDIYDIDLNE